MYPSVLLILFCFLFQTSRICHQLFRKNCLTRCWTETYKKVKYLHYQLHDLSVAATRVARCVYIQIQLLWEIEVKRERVARPARTTVVWWLGKQGEPPLKLYTISGRLPECWQCYITCIFLSCQHSVLPACLSLCQAVFLYHLYQLLLL